MAKKILTGIKPTGIPHLGNYIGAIRPALEHASKPGYEARYFIADYHALTTIRDREQFADYTHEVAAAWLACGLDPDKVLFYRQSDLPEVFELSWVLACMTSKGHMNRAHAYKAAVQANEEAGSKDPDKGINMGLFGYPVLMAADILLFQSDLVPVGQDQVQHVEIARDCAQKFNHYFGKVFKFSLPEHLIQEDTGTVPGLDGRKMSKSYGNIIPLFDPPKKLRKTIMKIVTDSTPPEEPKDPDDSIIFDLYAHFATPEQKQTLADRFRAGIGWGDAKQALFELLDETLAEPRERYNELIADRAKIDRLLAEGAEKARVIASEVMDGVRRAVGQKPL